MQEIVTKLQDSFPQIEEFRGDKTITVAPERLREALTTLKTRYQFGMLMDLFAMDYQKYGKPTPERFSVIYNLYSMQRRDRVRVRLWVSESKPSVDSIHDLFAAANWFEREAWDLFGIEFRNHPNLTRILCHNEFVGHPLRKDYPSDHYQRLKRALPAAGI